MCAVDEMRNYLVVFGGAGLEKEYNDVWIYSVEELLNEANSDEIDKIAWLNYVYRFIFINTYTRYINYIGILSVINKIKYGCFYTLSTTILSQNYKSSSGSSNSANSSSSSSLSKVIKFGFLWKGSDYLSL